MSNQEKATWTLERINRCWATEIQPSTLSAWSGADTSCKLAVGVSGVSMVAVCSVHAPDQTVAFTPGQARKLAHELLSLADRAEASHKGWLERHSDEDGNYVD